MKARLGYLIGMLLFSSAAFAQHANTAGPDFVNAAPRRHIDRALVASPDGTGRIDPYDVVSFGFDKAVLTDLGLNDVDTAARWLKLHPQHKIVLEGHTDALGVSAYNEDLATRRMDVVRKRLLAHGISPDRIVMISFGENEARDTSDPVFAADRKVVMYATRLAPEAVVAVVRQNRPAVVAYWSENGSMVQMQHGYKTSAQTVVGRR